MRMDLLMDIRTVLVVLPERDADWQPAERWIMTFHATRHAREERGVEKFCFPGEHGARSLQVKLALRGPYLE